MEDSINSPPKQETSMHRRQFFETAAFGVAASAQLPAMGPSAPRLERFDELMREIMRSQKLHGGSLSLAKEGRLVYARSFGWASVEERIAARPATLFGVASVSKAITAAAILRLVNQGRIGLDDRAFEILKLRPGDPRAHEITLRQLLTHSAGYKEQPDEAQVAESLRIPLSKLREKHLVASFMGRRLDYNPGEGDEYSNFGFVVLGAVIESVVAMPVGPAIHRLVFNPMKIPVAYYGHGGPHRPDTARPYDDQGKRLPAINIAGGSAGGLIISTVDLVRFLATLRGARGRRFVSKKTFEEMIASPKRPLKTRPDGTWYGLGWDEVAPSPRGPSYTKNGGMPGVRAVIGHRHEDVDWAVAFNGGRDVEGHIDVDAESTERVTRAVDRTHDWPDVDHFPQFDADVGR